MYLPDVYSNVIHQSRYARFRDDLGRRESWSETVERYVSFMEAKVSEKTGYAIDTDAVRSAILNCEVMPSMRAMMTAGPAADRSELAIFNCSAIPLDSPRAFDELLYILMNGTGAGFSVEEQFVWKLPELPDHFEDTQSVIHVADSKEGWAKALRELLALLWSGQVPRWDMSAVRPAGARLKVFGGRASGPEPLDRLFRFAVDLFKRAAGRKLTSLEAHDLACMVADVVVVGGVRRSALISLSDRDDRPMATAKSGAWWETAGHRRLANNSAVYNVKPSIGAFLTEWASLYESKSGERGIFNRKAIKAKVAENGRRKVDVPFLTNPCAEIFLRPYGLCNLTEVIVRPDDTLFDLKAKVALATELGTYQSLFTNFKYLRKIWQKNAEEERLLGVSLTGQLGHSVLNGSKGIEVLRTWLEELRGVAVGTNAVLAEALGINPSAAITCVKPSGTVSQLVGVSSGMHPWHNAHYIRTIRADKKDPLTSFLQDAGVAWEQSVTGESEVIFSFPVKAPEGAITRRDLTAIEHLELWLVYKQSWCEHNPSVTISVREDEWLEVGAWVYAHFDELTGVSFLPMSEHIYKQAPYQDVDAETYEAALEAQPKNIRWEDMIFYEQGDSTTGSQELACTSADGCEVVSIG